MTDLFDTARSELKARLDLLEDQVFQAKQGIRDMEAQAAVLRGRLAGMDEACELLTTRPLALPSPEKPPRRKIGDEITKLLNLRGPMRVEEITKALGIRSAQAQAALDRLVGDRRVLWPAEEGLYQAAEQEADDAA